jgi:hypothetical protein
MHPPGGLDDTAQAIEDLAANVLTEKDFVVWVLARIARWYRLRFVRPRRARVSGSYAALSAGSSSCSSFFFG